MSTRCGALLGLATAAIMVFGVFGGSLLGSTASPPSSYQGVAHAAVHSVEEDDPSGLLLYEAKREKPSYLGTGLDVLLGNAPEESTVYPGIQVASATASVSLPNVLMHNALLSQAGTCNGIYVDFIATPRQGPSPHVVELQNNTRQLLGFDDEGNPILSDDLVDITAIQWHFRRNGAEFDPDDAILREYNSGIPANQQPNLLVTDGEPNPPGPTNPMPFASGIWDIGMRVLVNGDFWCPPLDELPFFRNAHITVTEEGAPIDPPGSSISFTDLIQDSTALVPHNDWVPLFSFNMSFNPDEPAPRALTRLRYRLTGDPVSERPYPRGGVLAEHNFHEFGLFRDFGPDGVPDNQLDFNSPSGPIYDPNQPIVTWDGHGYPYQRQVPGGNFTTDEFGLQYNINDLVYDLSFVFDPRSPNYDPSAPFTDVPEIFDGPPKFPPNQWPVTGGDPGNNYIVAVRLSGTWQTRQTLGVVVETARVGFPSANDGFSQGIQVFDQPVNEDGEFVDSFSPDFYDGEVLNEETGYSSSFSVFDIRGDQRFDISPGDRLHNTINHPGRLYSPRGELTRPRWDISDTFIQAVSGEWLDIRELASIETWVPVLGIALHGADFTGGNAGITQLNLVLTDFGADPFGPPGNAGFNPNNALNTVTDHGVGGPDTIIHNDYSFSGVWLWHDTNNNGLFNPPTPTGTLGASLNDYPMIPSTPGAFELHQNFVDEVIYEWEYVPFPPGGGDPWWKMRLYFEGSRRRAGGATPTGYLEPTPDSFGAPPNLPRPDYFVVVRADSGFTDISGLQGDGTGMPLGTETRVMLEPRRWNPGSRGDSPAGNFPFFNGAPHWDGGILLSNQFMFREPEFSEHAWQDDSRIDMICRDDLYPCFGEFDYGIEDENGTPPEELAMYFEPLPWWPERTHAIENTKPIRFGIEVQDLVLTYSTSNVFAKETFINPGQFYTIVFRDRTVNTFEPIRQGNQKTILSLWTDPFLLLVDDRRNMDISRNIVSPGGATDNSDVFGISELRHFAYNTPGMTQSFRQAWSDVNDRFTAMQYSFETVPFRLSDDVIYGQFNKEPRSVFFPSPQTQPRLPSYGNWPGFAGGQALINAGNFSYVFLADEGEQNEPFHRPPTERSERTYEDDVYIFVVQDPQYGSIGNVAGRWLIDDRGARYYILSNNGPYLAIQHGHSAYLDRFYLNENLGELHLPHHPYGVQVGEQFAVQRGNWMIVNETVERGKLPRMSDWPAGPQTRSARLLKQRVPNNSQPVAMLGLNLAGVDDPAVNADGAPISLNYLTIAFWGPDFRPNHLAPLDPNGQLFTSGVQLYEDTNQNGVFDGPIFADVAPIPAFIDQIVPLQTNSLRWASAPEPVSLYGNVDENGNYIADDLSGDGLVFLGDPNNANDVAEFLATLTPEEQSRWDGKSDLAWVLKLRPATRWPLPQGDDRVGAPSGTGSTGTQPDTGNGGTTDPGTGDPGTGGGGIVTPPILLKSGMNNWPDFWTSIPELIDILPLLENQDSKNALDTKALPAGGNQGSDLYVAIRTSDNIGAHQGFRVVVPARLPSRSPASERLGGIQTAPLSYPTRTTYTKVNPDEGSFDFYGHDMLETGVPTRIVNLSGALVGDGIGATPQVTPDGSPYPVLGIDTATNRPNDVVGSGSSGEAVGNNQFRTPGHTWTQDVVNMHLVGFNADAEPFPRMEGYEIVAASGNTLTLRSGRPSSGYPWRVMRNTTYLEEVIVEIHDVTNNLDFSRDFLPLDFEDPANGLFSGVSLYRDNNFHPSNTIGVFDPPVPDGQGGFEYVDLPIHLDFEPMLVGTPGEPEYQIRFVFSSPGTDNLVGRNTVPYDTQPRLRQPIPTTFGTGISHPDFGPDFFVVVRPSRNMDIGKAFRAAVVSWGPVTPTQPDPDNFKVGLDSASGQRADEYNLFSEFPFASRGVGYISFFQEAPRQHYWTYNKVTRRDEPVTERDTSQDNRDVRYWMRTHPSKSGRTAVITASEPPEIEFFAEPVRQRVGGDVVFTLVTTFDPISVLWDFGDGNTSDELNPVHQYDTPGIYTVSVVVTDPNGNRETVTRPNYIEILNVPFAYFFAEPLEGFITPRPTGPPGLDVVFTEASDSGEAHVAQSFFWEFGDGQTSTERNPVHRYTEPGIYTVSLEVTFVSPDGTIIDVYTREAYIIVRLEDGGEGEGEGEGEDQDAANFTVTNIIRDQEALVPLTNWVPLFNFTMGYGEDAFAPRVLESLRYTLRPDQRTGLPYANVAGPEQSDILEFGLFLETFSDEDGDNNNLDEDNDILLYTWGNDGAPLGQLIQSSPFFGLTYQLDFIGNGTAANPEFPVESGPEGDNTISGLSYIVAVRTSATWRSQTTMNAIVEQAVMVDPDGNFPVNDEFEPLDSYEPNFLEGDILEEEASYSSSFGVFDITGSFSDQSGIFNNTWSHPHFFYTPIAEFTRPRWNQLDQLLEVVGGGILEMRSLISMESWVPVLGINLHSTKALHFDQYEPFITSRVISSKDAAQLREVNIIMTDIGADPYGVPGNGGFDPRTGLNKITHNVVNFGGEPAFNQDIAFNGLWVWHDTNGNGIFDPPTPTLDGAVSGVNFSGDYPLFGIGTRPAWEYIPFPPGGGDPWWKIQLQFYEGRRRTDDLISDENNTEGFLEAVPNDIFGSGGTAEISYDYFVVVRTDSGYIDVSLDPAVTPGIAMGADFRTFIEPRRFDPNTGDTTGGIYVDSMIPPHGSFGFITSLDGVWQNDPRWLIDEPWWPQRTHNAFSVKPQRVGIDVYDLVMTYVSDSDWAVSSDLEYSFTAPGVCLGYASGLFIPTDFDRWVDPFGLLQSQFFNLHSVGVSRWSIWYNENIDLLPGDGPGFDWRAMYSIGGRQYAFETAPFFNWTASYSDEPPVGPRSNSYINPPERPTLPDYSNWSGQTAPGDLPRLSQWRDEVNQARLLTQKIDINSIHTPMLGFNLVGADDPVVNARNNISLAQITVAFWGPDFHPDKLMPLDSRGRSLDSGVLLWEDTDQNGTFFVPQQMESYLESPQELPSADQIVPLENLRWRSVPEFIDMTGDGLPDDLNGDGIIDDRDKAWVLTITPADLWDLPYNDNLTFGEIFSFALIYCVSIDFGSSTKDAIDYMTHVGPGYNNFIVERNRVLSDTLKALDPEADNSGMDLYLTVRTSDNMARFEQFRAIVPATLPGRPENQRKAGIQFFPQFNTSPSAFIKRSPEEDPVQDFYGHDMIEVNVPTKVTNMAAQNSQITIGGPGVPVLGLNLSTNRPENNLLKGNEGYGLPEGFIVPDVNWQLDQYAGDWLVDSRYETYEITGNSANELFLRSGEPRDGAFRIVRDPSFLEQVVVELYNVGTERTFNPSRDLLPLDINQEISGLALYRDNDNHPDNRNGLFDPGIDIPISLDAPPMFIGQVSQNIQVKFVFSTPGTDDVPIQLESQPRNRQWVHNSFGNSGADAEFGADFFIVARASDQMRENVNFRAGIVSWGPNTPTEPDPDTWANLVGEDRNDFLKFQEFPWGSRGVGYITFFKEPPVRYFLDGAIAGKKVDNSGFDWIRSHSAVKRRSSIVTARPRPTSPYSVIIESVSKPALPVQILPDDNYTLLINGSGFGTNPVVHISGYDVEVIGATDTQINVRLVTNAMSTPVEPVALLVRNPARGEESTRTDLFSLIGDSGVQPVITEVRPKRGGEQDFPVTIIGSNFGTKGNVQVLFGNTLMPVLSVNTEGTRIEVAFPLGGLPTTGFQNVTVRNTEKKTETTKMNAFEFINDANRPAKRLGCYAANTDKATSSGDMLLILLAVGILILVSRISRNRRYEF